MSNTIRLSAAVLVGAAFLGCGGGGGDAPKGLPLKGKVTFEGEPVGRPRSTDDDNSQSGAGSISLMLQGSNKAFNAPIVAGEYAFTPNQEVEEGTYRVEINWTKATGKKVRDRESGEVSDGFQNVIPSKYNKTSELRAEVSAKKLQFDFDLKK
jgi:hypothetical protein